MKSLSKLILCVLGAVLLIGCNDPYRPAANPDAAYERALAEQRQKAEAERLKAEQEAQARAEAQTEAQWERAGAGSGK